MVTETAEQWLEREVDEVLAEFSVGLYELIWILNSQDSPFSLNDEDKKATATAVASKILDEGRAKLYRLRWAAQETVEGPLDRDVLDEDATWAVEPAEIYVALVPE
jgi:hypothetical protein